MPTCQTIVGLLRWCRPWPCQRKGEPSEHDWTSKIHRNRDRLTPDRSCHRLASTTEHHAVRAQLPPLQCGCWPNFHPSMTWPSCQPKACRSCCVAGVCAPHVHQLHGGSESWKGREISCVGLQFPKKGMEHAFLSSITLGLDGGCTWRKYFMSVVFHAVGRLQL